MVGGLWRSQSMTAAEAAKVGKPAGLLSADSFVLPKYMRDPAPETGPSGTGTEVPTSPLQSSPWNHLWSLQEDVLEKEAPTENIVFQAPRKVKSQNVPRRGGRGAPGTLAKAHTAAPSYLAKSVEDLRPSREKM